MCTSTKKINRGSREKMLTEMVETLRPLRLPNNDIFLRVLQWNKSLPHPFDDAELLAAIRLVGSDGTGAAETFPEPIVQKAREPAPPPEVIPAPKRETDFPESKTSQGVNPGYSDTQDIQDTQRYSPRGAPPPPPPSASTNQNLQQENQKNLQQESQSEDAGRGREIPIDLPLKKYVAWAYERAAEMKEESNWKVSPLFFFVRCLQPHPKLATLHPLQAFATVERILAKSTRDCPWEHHFRVNRDNAEGDFQGCWQAMRYHLGENPLPAGWNKAKQCTFALKPEIGTNRPRAYPLFVSLAGWLQVTMGDRNVLLPVQEVGKLMKVDKSLVSRYVRWAIEDGYLKRVASHEPGKRAAEYRFDVSRFASLQKAAQAGTQESFDVVENR
jgi:hypothetical protein